MNLKTYYNLQSTQAIFFIKHTSSLGREEASFSFNKRHADWHKAPPEELRSIYSPWPFHTWGIDILGPFPLAIRQMKYLIVTIEYFTKWIEAEPVAQITAHKVQHFVWKNIVCRFGVPRRLVSENGTQFASQ